MVRRVGLHPCTLFSVPSIQHGGLEIIHFFPFYKNASWLDFTVRAHSNPGIGNLKLLDRPSI
jgi:hypothetical protein